jgi:hypothetical protein
MLAPSRQAARKDHNIHRLPPVLRLGPRRSKDASIGYQDVKSVVFFFELRDKCGHRCEVAMVENHDLPDASESGLFADLCRSKNTWSQVGSQGSGCLGSPARAASPLLFVRTANISLAGLIRARCFAAASPRPPFDPVTITVWPERSTVCTAGNGQNWERRKAGRENFAMLML